MTLLPSASARAEAHWLERERLRRLVQDEQQVGAAVRLLLVAAVLAAWSLGGSPLPAGGLLLGLAGLIVLALVAYRSLGAGEPLDPTRIHPWITVGVAIDALLLLLLALAAPAPNGDWVFLFALLALKSVLLVAGWPAARWLPFGFLPLYALALVMRGGPDLWLTAGAGARALLLLLLALLARHVGRQVREAREQAWRLFLQLGQRKADLDTRTTVLTQTATNLANRVLELRSLQEGMKAINASLDLDELLDLVVDNVSEVFGGAHCAIALRDAGNDLYVAARSPGVDLSRVGDGGTLEALAAQVVRGGEPLLLEESVESLPDRLWAAMAVPMVVDGQSIGALIATREGYFPFTSDDQQRLSAFADQAALAVKNSRLYEQVEHLYQEVKERSAELKAVLDSIGDAVVVMGPRGNVRLANPVATLILGLPDMPSPNHPLPRAVLRGGFEEHLRSTLDSESGDPVMGELTVRSGSLQRNRTYQAHSAPLRDPDGRPRGIVTVLRDITAIKELELLKSNFVGTISHELKTPLHSIKGFVDIILSERSTGPLTDVQRDFLTTVRDQTNRLERMIVDLLEFSRLESGQIKLNPERLDLAALAEAMAEQLRPVAEEAGVMLRCTIDQALSVEGDRLRVEQVFHNLIANAIKFTPTGGRVSVEGGLAGAQAEIVVRDTGIGIPPDEQERIFERFYQVDASQTRQYGGTGLGLAICKHIIERHGGRIWVESAPSQGSTFHFTLPRELAPAIPLTVDFSRLEE